MSDILSYSQWFILQHFISQTGLSLVHLYQNSEKDNMLNKRVLLIPDAYLGDFSGAYVSQIAKKLLLELGCTVAVYSDEVTEDKVEEDGTKLYYRYPCNFTANWFQGKHKKQYTHVLD